MEAVVDRIEENIAVLILCYESNKVIILPLFLLPDINEGDVVDIIIKKNDLATAIARKKSQESIKRIKK
jgi:hypothetical protein